MNNNLSIQLSKDYEQIKVLAPVVPIETVAKEKHAKLKIEIVKKEDQLPLFYDSPIFKTKKHDLL